MSFSPLAVAVAFFAVLILLFPERGHAANVTIQIMNGNRYQPADITISPGDTVTWINNDSVSHTVTADNGAFDSGAILAGQSFSATFSSTGAYRYYCKYHGGVGGQGMSGSVTVAGGYVPPSSGVGPTLATYAANNGLTTPTGQAPTSLAAQAQALMAQIEALKAQLATAQGGAAVTGAGTVTYDSSSCPQIGGTLKRGSSGDDVSRLQTFLARDAAVYPEAQVSGTFGPLTEKAVQRWQAKYHVVSSGTPSSTGYGVVGPRTAAAIAILCTTGSYNGVPAPGPNDAPVGGFITVSPIAGAAPLTVNVVTTINTTNSCLPATYTLDFGDDSQTQQIPVRSGDCKQSAQTYPHTYQYGGNYTIKLSAGSHSTTATVNVTGPAAPPKPVFTPGLPKESFAAYPTSGPVPLTVTFSGIVNSNDAGFCNGGCVNTMDYGDGAADSVDLPASVGGWLNYTLQHTYTKVGGFRATLYQGGAGPAQPTVGSVTIIVGQQPQNGGSGYAYQPPTIISAGNDSLSFTTTFDLPSPCTGYTLSWGDGTGDAIQPDASATCQQAPVVKQLSHTYTAGGQFTVTLKRGPSLGRIDDISLTISN